MKDFSSTCTVDMATAERDSIHFPARVEVQNFVVSFISKIIKTAHGESILSAAASPTSELKLKEGYTLAGIEGSSQFT